LEAVFGYKVLVLEASERVGGRVHTFEDFAPGKKAEGGGELIGSNHPLWNSYKELFSLNFSDVHEYGNSPVRINGHTLTFEQSATLLDELEEQQKALELLAERIVDPFEPWTNRDAARLDGLSFRDWLNGLPKAKYLMRLRERFWKKYGSSPTLTEDGPVDITWETTEDEKLHDYVMVAFSRAKDADTCRSWPSSTQRDEYMRALEEVYPGRECGDSRYKVYELAFRKMGQSLVSFPANKRSNYMGSVMESRLWRMAALRGRTHLLCIHGLYGRSVEFRLSLGATISCA
jgi:monoamine oxidase